MPTFDINRQPQFLHERANPIHSSAQYRSWPAIFKQTGSTFSPKTLLVCLKNANRQH